MSTARNGTILVIDDEEIMREILETLLTREGYEVRLASSGAEGLEIARALPIDAALSGAATSAQRTIPPAAMSRSNATLCARPIGKAPSARLRCAGTSLPHTV